MPPRFTALDAVLFIQHINYSPVKRVKLDVSISLQIALGQASGSYFLTENIRRLLFLIVITQESVLKHDNVSYLVAT